MSKAKYQCLKRNSNVVSEISMFKSKAEYQCLKRNISGAAPVSFGYFKSYPNKSMVTVVNNSTSPGFNCWFSFAPVFQWCCSTPQESPGVGRNTFLSSHHLCFIIVFICDLFVSRDDPLMS